MGWASGSDLLQEVAEIVMPHVPKKNRDRVATALIEAFMDCDCDTINEVTQKDIKAAYDVMYPPEDDEYDDP